MMIDRLALHIEHAKLAQKRLDLAPETEAAFRAFSTQVFADGALSSRMKQIIAVAVAHVTQCPYCIRGHTTAALRHGVSEQALMEAIWVASEMRAEGSYAHAVLAVDEMEKLAAKTAQPQTVRFDPPSRDRQGTWPRSSRTFVVRSRVE
jgi:AhpD family alkylhydroperoxidase